VSPKQPKNVLLTFFTLLTFFSMSHAWANDLFNGKWIYEQTCGPQQVASVRLSQKGSDVTGEWSDGSTRGSGVYGQLKGKLKNNRLFVRYCGGDESAGYGICPKYAAEVSDYFVRQGKDLVWYKKTNKKLGLEYERYLVLYSTINDNSTIVDSHCADN
jgi:hypothetical protein